MESDFSPVKVYRDNKGYWYVIPVEKAGQFHSMLRDASEEGSDEYGSMQEGFDDTYADYCVGEDLESVQLYIKAQ